MDQRAGDVLARIAAELSHLADAGAGLQERSPENMTTALQSLDLMTQTLAALSFITAHVATIIPAHCPVAVTAFAEIRLSGLARRLQGLDHEAAEAGGYELF